MSLKPSIVPSRYTHVRLPEKGSYLNLSYLKSIDPILLAPGSIPRQFKVIVLGKNITTLEEGVIHPDVEILMVYAYTEDMVLPDGLKVLIIKNFHRESPIPKATVQRIMIHKFDCDAGHRLGTHWLYCGTHTLNEYESSLQRSRYDIEELNTIITVGNNEYYTVKRIPRVKPKYPYSKTGNYLDLSDYSSTDLELIDRIPERFTEIHMGHNASFLMGDILHSKVETLHIRGTSTKDLILPDGLVNLIVADPPDDWAQLAETRKKVTNIFVNAINSNQAACLGVHHLHCIKPIEEEKMQRNLYHIDENLPRLTSGSWNYYVVKRTPKAMVPIDRVPKQAETQAVPVLEPVSTPVVPDVTEPEPISTPVVPDVTDILVIKAAVDILTTQITTETITDETRAQIVLILKQLEGSVGTLIEIFTALIQPQ